MNIRNEIEILIKVVRGAAAAMGHPHGLTAKSPGRSGLEDRFVPVLRDLRKTWADIRERFPLPIQPVDMAEGGKYLSEKAREDLKRSVEAIGKVDHALGWGLLGFDLVANALEEVLKLPSFLGPAERAQKVAEDRRSMLPARAQYGLLIDPDPDAPGGGPFGRVIGGPPPEGFAGPPEAPEDFGWSDTPPPAPERVVAPSPKSGDVFPKGRSTQNGWIGVDFDGTLATGDRPWPEIGDPVPAMVDRVRRWLAAGIEVRIVTVRAGESGQADRIHDWLVLNGLPKLEVTDRKSIGMFQLWDDRAVRVERDTGRVLGPEPEAHKALGPALAPEGYQHASPSERFREE